MQYAYDADSPRLGSIEHDVFPYFKPAQIGLNYIARAAHRGTLGQKLKRILQLSQVSVRLNPTPVFSCICSNPIGIRFRFE